MRPAASMCRAVCGVHCYAAAMACLPIAAQLQAHTCSGTPIAHRLSAVQVRYCTPVLPTCSSGMLPWRLGLWCAVSHSRTGIQPQLGAATALYCRRVGSLLALRRRVVQHLTAYVLHLQAQYGPAPVLCRIGAGYGTDFVNPVVVPRSLSRPRLGGIMLLRCCIGAATLQL
jgi:hypothetical protein